MTHLLDSLHNAAKLAVHPRRGNINLAHWAVTYRCSRDVVEEALKLAENGSRKLPEEQAALSPPEIPYDQGDGK